MGGLDSARILTPDEVVDEATSWQVLERTTRHHGFVFDTVTERVATPSGEQVTRDWIAHRGAVGVIALDDADRVVLVRQYRHPVRHRLWEPPAGLLDVPGEQAVTAAARELAEEAQLQAAEWHTLVDLFTSPGMSSESIRVFLARGLSAAPVPDGFVASGEEAHLELGVLPLADVVARVLSGRLQNPLLVAGALAAWAANNSADGWSGLRAADAPWPAREHAETPGE